MSEQQTQQTSQEKPQEKNQSAKGSGKKKKKIHDANSTAQYHKIVEALLQSDAKAKFDDKKKQWIKGQKKYLQGFEGPMPCKTVTAYENGQILRFYESVPVPPSEVEKVKEENRDHYFI